MPSSIRRILSKYLEGVRARMAAYIILAVVVASLSAFVGYRVGYGSGEGSLEGLMGRCSVLYIDQLSGDYPNSPLTAQVVRNLTSIGCSVTVLPSNEFTLNSFKLFKYYDVIIFRGHTGWANYLDPETGRVKVLVGWFTGERYSRDAYPDLQRRGLVVEGVPLLRPVEGYNKTYVAVTQYYIKEYVTVKEGSVFILATCFSGSQILADILLEKGASVVIGWDKNVTIYKADLTLSRLVEEYVKTHDWAEAARRLPLEYKVEEGTGATLQLYINPRSG